MAEKKRRKISIPDLYAMKNKGEKIAWLTAYDYPTASMMDQAGIEMILVGDSAAMTMHGHPNTMPITMDEMISHAKAVKRACHHTFLIGDMPFLTYHVSVEDAIYNAGRFMKEAGMDAIKLEGGTRVAPIVKGIVNAGIPVMGHIGLTPQSSAMLGGFKVQGKSAESAIDQIEDAKALEEAGVFGILLECIPTPVSAKIRQSIDVLTFSIGAGPVCDGQLLIVHDMLGLFQAFQPKFVRQYCNLSEIMLKAFADYIKDVKEGTFPASEHEYTIPEAELEKLEKILAGIKK
ncbi:MAG: 3-methyl-2-oxobutanoate hydroxymethyltransferase [Pseudomonadota bacterium]